MKFVPGQGQNHLAVAGGCAANMTVNDQATHPPATARWF